MKKQLGGDPRVEAGSLTGSHWLLRVAPKTPPLCESMGPLRTGLNGDEKTCNHSCRHSDTPILHKITSVKSVSKFTVVMHKICKITAQFMVFKKFRVTVRPPVVLFIHHDGSGGISCGDVLFSPRLRRRKTCIYSWTRGLSRDRTGWTHCPPWLSCNTS